MSQNEAAWQFNHRYRIEHTRGTYFPEASAGFITKVMWRRYRRIRSFISDLGYFFEDVFPGLELGAGRHTGASPNSRQTSRPQLPDNHLILRRSATSADQQLSIRQPRKFQYSEEEDPPTTNLGKISRDGDDKGDAAGAMDDDDDLDWDPYYYPDNDQYEEPPKFPPPVLRTPLKVSGPGPEPGASILFSPKQLNHPSIIVESQQGTTTRLLLPLLQFRRPRGRQHFLQRWSARQCSRIRGRT